MSTTVNEAINQSLTVKAEVKVAEPTFGNGKYSKVAEVAYNMAKFYLGINEAQATKFAKAYASDLGRLNVNIDKISLGTISDDGYISIRESGKSAKIKCTDSMRICSILNALEKAFKLGVASFKGIQLNSDLTKWLQE